MRKTPYGDDCIAFKRDSPIVDIIMREARGSWQREVASNLINQGYVIGYLATGPLRGKAKSYSTKYARSLSNLMDRIGGKLSTQTPYWLLYGRVGPKGAFGYFINDLR